jgi:hypothetical protein
MITAQIKLYDEPQRYIPPVYSNTTKSKSFSDSHAIRVEDKPKPQISKHCRAITQEEYDREVKYFLSKGFTVGQTIWEKYSASSIPFEKVFVKILPIEFCFVRSFGGSENFEIIEIWQQNNDWFSTTCPHKLFKTQEDARKGEAL